MESSATEFLAVNDYGSGGVGFWLDLLVVLTEGSRECILSSMSRYYAFL